MSRPLLPPRGHFTGTRWLFDPALSAPIKETLLQLMALTWGRDGHTTPPLSYAQLEALTGKNARTLRGHLLALRTYHAALRLQPAGTGTFIAALADWLFNNTYTAPDTLSAQVGEVLPKPYLNQEEEEELNPSRDVFLVLPHHHDHGAAWISPDAARTPPTGIAAPRQKPVPQPAKKTLTRPLEKRLREAGVFPALLPEVEARAAQWQYSAKEIDRLLDWCADEQPERPAALFIGRVRAGARAPAVYNTAPCVQCGRRGKHADDCTQRYTQGF